MDRLRPPRRARLTAEERRARREVWADTLRILGFVPDGQSRADSGIWESGPARPLRFAVDPPWFYGTTVLSPTLEAWLFLQPRQGAVGPPAQHPQPRDRERFVECPTARRLQASRPHGSGARVTVTYYDVVDLADWHARDVFRVGLLNMAAPINVGGGVWAGSGSQEEELMRRTTAFLGMRDAAQVGGGEQGRRTDRTSLDGRVEILRQVRVIREGQPGYENRVVRPGAPFMVFSAAALQMGRAGCGTADMRSRIHLLLTSMEAMEVQVAILGAWGCGAFGLDPWEVAALFRERLRVSSLPQVIFGIAYDGPGDVTRAFREIFAA